jgi:hypothetical protein
LGVQGVGVFFFGGKSELLPVLFSYYIFFDVFAYYCPDKNFGLGCPRSALRLIYEPFCFTL